ncbi:MAG TPA: SCP2 sterol-binding domain-containing protein [Solimonas sp.]|nr:SCP2 sterol-binding domain-containing protein [Solimonas sp.]
MTPAFLVAALEVALNRYLALDAGVLAEAGTLSGRVIGLGVDGLGWDFYLEFTERGVRVLSELERAPDVAVRGPLGRLMRLAWQVSQGESGIPQGLAIDGDTELLTRFNRMLARVGFEPEEFAAKFVGDAAAHRLGQGVQSLLGFGRKTVGTLALDGAEYLREETGDLAGAADVAEWTDAVEALRDAVARFEARLAQLEARSAP